MSIYHSHVLIKIFDNISFIVGAHNNYGESTKGKQDTCFVMIWFYEH